MVLRLRRNKKADFRDENRLFSLRAVYDGALAVGLAAGNGHAVLFDLEGFFFHENVKDIARNADA